MTDDGPAPACRDHPTLPPDAWFSTNPAVVRRVLAVCAGCPLREPCAAVADEYDERWGVWGGVPRGVEQAVNLARHVKRRRRVERRAKASLYADPERLAAYRERARQRAAARRAAETTEQHNERLARQYASERTRAGRVSGPS